MLPWQDRLFSTKPYDSGERKITHPSGACLTAGIESALVWLLVNTHDVGRCYTHPWWSTRAVEQSPFNLDCDQTTVLGLDFQFNSDEVACHCGRSGSSR